MMYLLKVTIIWTVFLLFFEVFYKSSSRFTLNRIYLLCSVAAGLLLPLISLPSGTPGLLSATHAFYPVAQRIAPAEPQIVVPATTHAATASSLDIWLILRIIYGLGIAFLSLKFLFELGRIIRLILSHPYQLIAGHRVIITGKEHAPYSFMNWIFINDIDAYPQAELEYIIFHEAAHNYKKHWLDLLSMQLVCIAFWFHPLIWRYCYLLQLQHEYEADDFAASTDAYAYGHFLLQQTLLSGVPGIAHSFHFSPIKNRINMLTKRHNRKPGAWKYLFLIPALFVCTVLMARTISQDNVTTYKGNTFAWRQTDTLFYDAEKKRPALASAKADKKKQIIYNMNGEPVYQNEYLKTPATNSKNQEAYIDYLKEKFHALCKNASDSLAGISVVSIVISKEGKVVNFDVRYVKPYLRTGGDKMQWDPLLDTNPVLNNIMDKVITNAPNWKPAMINGKPVNSIVSFIPYGC